MIHNDSSVGRVLLLGAVCESAAQAADVGLQEEQLLLLSRPVRLLV